MMRGKKKEGKKALVSVSVDDAELAEWENYTPVELIEKQVRKSIQRIATLRDEAVSEDVQLRAASKLIDKHLPEKIEQVGSFVVQFVVQPYDTREDVEGGEEIEIPSEEVEKK